VGEERERGVFALLPASNLISNPACLEANIATGYNNKQHHKAIEDCHNSLHEWALCKNWNKVQMLHCLTKEQWIYIKQEKPATSFIPTQSKPVTTKTGKEAQGSTTTSSHGISWRAKIHGRLSGPPKNKAWKHSYFSFSLYKESRKFNSCSICSIKSKPDAGAIPLTRLGEMPRATADPPIVYSSIKAQQTNHATLYNENWTMWEKKLNSTRHAIHQHYSLNDLRKLPYPAPTHMYE
jgi:hypothetical protein